MDNVRHHTCWVTNNVQFQYKIPTIHKKTLKTTDLFRQWSGYHRPCASVCMGGYRWQLRGLILLQLLLEAVVWADKGADGLDGRQTLIPFVVCDSHQVGHHHGCAPRDACEAAAKKHSDSCLSRTQSQWYLDGWGISTCFSLWTNVTNTKPTSGQGRFHHSGDIRGWS